MISGGPTPRPPWWWKPWRRYPLFWKLYRFFKGPSANVAPLYPMEMEEGGLLSYEMPVSKVLTSCSIDGIYFTADVPPEMRAKILTSPGAYSMSPEQKDHEIRDANPSMGCRVPEPVCTICARQRKEPSR